QIFASSRATFARSPRYLRRLERILCAHPIFCASMRYFRALTQLFATTTNYISDRVQHLHRSLLQLAFTHFTENETREPSPCFPLFPLVSLLFHRNETGEPSPCFIWFRMCI